jgi:hypothetical protein
MKFAINNCNTALTIGKFDTVKIYTMDDIDTFYKNKNSIFFNSKRLSGYFVWKSYIILKHLITMDEGDILCYNDSKYLWLKNIREFENNILTNTNIGVYSNKPNGPTHVEKQWSKLDAYVLMNVRNTPNITDSNQAWAGFILLKKNSEIIVFISEWLTYSQDPRISTDIQSVFGPNDASFIENRHDQTALSLLCKKWNIPFNTLDKSYMIDVRNPPK